MFATSASIHPDHVILTSALGREIAMAHFDFNHSRVTFFGAEIPVKDLCGSVTVCTSHSDALRTVGRAIEWVRGVQGAVAAK